MSLSIMRRIMGVGGRAGARLGKLRSAMALWLAGSTRRKRKSAAKQPKEKTKKRVRKSPRSPEGFVGSVIASVRDLPVPQKVLLGLTNILSVCVAAGALSGAKLVLKESAYLIIFVVACLQYMALLGVIPGISRLRQGALCMLLISALGYMTLFRVHGNLTDHVQIARQHEGAQAAWMSTEGGLLRRAELAAETTKAAEKTAHDKWRAECDGRGRTGKPTCGPVADRIFDDELQPARKAAALAEANLQIVRKAFEGRGPSALPPQIDTKKAAARLYADSLAVWGQIPAELRKEAPEPRRSDYLNERLDTPLLAPLYGLRDGSPAFYASVIAYCWQDLLLILLVPFVLWTKPDIAAEIKQRAKEKAALIRAEKNGKALEEYAQSAPPEPFLDASNLPRVLGLADLLGGSKLVLRAIAAVIIRITPSTVPPPRAEGQPKDPQQAGAHQELGMQLQLGFPREPTAESASTSSSSSARDLASAPKRRNASSRSARDVVSIAESRDESSACDQIALVPDELWQVMRQMWEEMDNLGAFHKKEARTAQDGTLWFTGHFHVVYYRQFMRWLHEERSATLEQQRGDGQRDDAVKQVLKHHAAILPFRKKG